jgi:phenylpyruvate tautomerase PptA (4-oxalocrotonate tautomerase family)
MPLVRISIPAHLAVEKARALADAVHGALVSTCNIPANELFQLISRFSATNMLIDPTFPDVERSADASIVEITLLTGRSDDRKRSLYRAIAAGAVAAGFRSDDVMVALIENGPIDWSLGRGEAYDKHAEASQGFLTPSPAAAARGSTAPP